MNAAKLLVLFSSLILISGCTKEPKTENEKLSYAYGVQIANGLKKQSIEMNTEMISNAIKDVLKKNKLQMSEEEIQSALFNLSKTNDQANHQLGQQQLESGRVFIENYIKTNSAKVTQKGVAYKVIKAGQGSKANINQKVKINYEGKLIDGTVFDSTIVRGQPAEFALKNVFPGWQEVLTLMPTGSQWEVVIPAHLAYGDTGNQLIPANSTVVFNIELIEVK